MAGWILIVEWLSRFVLLGLVGLSIWSISIILERRALFRKIRELKPLSEIEKWILAQDRNAVQKWTQESGEDFRKEVFSDLLSRGTSQSVEALFSYHMGQQRKKFEKGLNVLGTLGSTTPFVGLFGTILGIIVAFGALSTGQIDSQKVMYALAEALILTAVGLAVAIPSVVAFNYFSAEWNKLERDLYGVKDLLVSLFVESK